MATPSVYQFDDPADFAAFELEQRQLKNPRFSLRAWSLQLGYSTPSYLGQVLKKQRRFKIDLARKISLNMKLPNEEQKYFEALVLLQNCKSNDEKSVYAQLLETLKPRDRYPSQLFEYDHFRLISDWHYVAILEVVNLAGFDGSSEFIEQKLDHRLSRYSLEASIDRLLRLKLLSVTKDNKIRRSSGEAIVFDQDIPYEAVRSYHTQVLQKAQEALVSQSEKERDFRASAVSIKLKNVAEARRILKRAHQELLALNADGDGDDVYQIQTSLFRLTKMESKK